MQFKIGLLLLSLISLVSAAGGMSGWKSVETQASRDEKEKFAAWKPMIEGFLGLEDQPYHVFEPTEFKTQVVAGLIYMVRYVTGPGQSITARVFVPLPYTQEDPSVEYVINEAGVKIDAPAILEAAQNTQGTLFVN